MLFFCNYYEETKQIGTENGSFIQYLRNNFGIASFRPERTVSQRFKVGLHLRQVVVRFMSKNMFTVEIRCFVREKKDLQSSQEEIILRTEA